MNNIVVSCIAFVCIFGGVLLTLLVSQWLPSHHLNQDTKDVVRLGAGLIGTMAALVLGLLIASAKSSFDTQSAQVRQMTAGIILLVYHLAQYGPETRAARGLVRSHVGALADRIWHEGDVDLLKNEHFAWSAAAQQFYLELQGLSPQTEVQRFLQSQSIRILTELGRTRLLLFEQANTSIPMPFLVVLIFWLTIIFASFSLFVQPNAIIVGSLLVFGLSIVSAIFLIQELSHPFGGLMQISSLLLRNALLPLGP